MAKPQSHGEFVQKLLANPQVRAEYDRLETGFALLREILSARKAAGLTQAQVADRMGTQHKHPSHGWKRDWRQENCPPSPC